MAQSGGNTMVVGVRGIDGTLSTDVNLWTQMADGSSTKLDMGRDGRFELVIVGDKVVIDVADAQYGRDTVEAIVPAGHKIYAAIVFNGPNDAELVIFDGARHAQINVGDVAGATEGAGVTCEGGVGCQNPDQEGHGAAGTLAATSDLNPNAGFRVADNFSAETGGVIENVCWWGVYIDFAAGVVPCDPGPGDNFTITYYNDDAGGSVPGTIFSGPHTVTVNAKFATGNLLAGFVPEIQFEGSHEPVEVGTDCLWIEIVNDTMGGDCFWLWDTAPPGDGAGSQDFAPTDYDLAWCLDIETLPQVCAGPPGTGACCFLDDASCMDDLTQLDCEGMGGSYAGDDTVCDDVNCEAAQDDCEGAISLDIPSVTIGNNIGAQMGNTPDCGTSITPGVWYSIIGTGTTVTASTCNAADYDTKITVYCGGCDDPLCIDGVDDTAGCANFSTEVSWCAKAGAEYLILIHGFAGDEGNFTLTMSENGVECEPTVDCPVGCEVDEDCPDGFQCDDGDCVLIPTGGCCQCDGADQFCTTETEADCAAIGGAYLGDDASCTASGETLTVTSMPNVALPDGTPAGVDDSIVIGDSFTVVDLEVQVSISHTWIGDLCVTLSKDGGPEELLMSRIGADTGGNLCHSDGPFGCSEDNMNVVLDDDAAASIEAQCASALQGTYRPDPGSLARFIGGDSAGTWTLNVSDNAAADFGTWIFWSLSLTAPAGGDTPCEEAFPDQCDDTGCFTVTASEVVCHADGTSFTWYVTGTDTCTGGESSYEFTANGGAVGEEMCFMVDIGTPHEGICCTAELCVEIPDCTPRQKSADLNGDGVVAIADLLILFGAWGQCDACDTPVACPADLDYDCDVGIADMLSMFEQWG